MQSTITRRAALTGTAAGAAAIVAGTVPAIAVDHADAELLDLERQLEAMILPLTEAKRQEEAAEDRWQSMHPEHANGISQEHWTAWVRSRHEAGCDDAGEALEAIWRQVDAITNRAREIEAHTFLGLAVKARMIAFEAWHLLFREPEPDLDWEPKVIRGFLTEAMQLGGREPLSHPCQQTDPEGVQS